MAYRVASVTIPNGGSLSDAALMADNETLIMIEGPPAWTAASLSMSQSIDGIAYFGDRSKQLSTGNIAASTFPASLLTNSSSPATKCKGYKLLSGTPAAPVNQGGDRTFRLLFLS